MITIAISRLDKMINNKTEKKKKKRTLTGESQV